MTDAELIRAMQSGDEAALAEFYRRYLPSIWRYARARINGCAQAAEDAVAETFVAAIRGIRRVEPDGPPLAAWLMGIARHKVADHHRRAARKFAELTQAAEATNGAPRPLEYMELQERRAAVAEALDAMRDQERQVLEWKYIDGLSVREIGQRLGRSEKGAESLLYRARLAFRAAYEQICPVHREAAARQVP